MRIYILQEWIGDNWSGYWGDVSYTHDFEVASNWNDFTADRSFAVLEEYVPPA